MGRLRLRLTARDTRPCPPSEVKVNTTNLSFYTCSNLFTFSTPSVLLNFDYSCLQLSIHTSSLVRISEVYHDGTSFKPPLLRWPLRTKCD